MLASVSGRRRPLLRLLAGLLTTCALLGLLAPPSQALGPDGLRARLSRAMGLAGPLAGAYVQDLDTGAALYARKDTVPRPPASVQKLYTTSTALLRFGPDASLRTEILAAGAVDALGVLRGNLYLRGGGDPTLSRAKIAALAATVAAQSGIVRVDGSVLGDETLFDSRRGAARTAFAFDRDIGGVLSGLAVGRGFSRDAAPALEAARRFVKALRAAGVRVDGRTGVGPTPVEAREVAGVDSPPMFELARLTNVPSDNFAAEMLLKALGAAFGGAGTTPAGAAVVRQQLSVFGIAPRVVDGSGLSRSNRTSPRQVVALLAGMHAQEEVGPAFESSLAVAGRTGTARRRMRGTPAQDRCRTKTGTLRAVSALAGYCVTTAGRTVAFAMLMSTRKISRAHVLQDRMTAAIATYGS